MIKRKVSTIQLLHMLCAIGIAMITGTLCTSSHESGEMRRYTKYRRMYNELAQLQTERFDLFRRKIFGSEPSYMEGFLDASQFKTKENELETSLNQKKAKFEAAYIQGIHKFHSNDIISFSDACVELTAASRNRNTDEESYYQDILSKQLDSIDSACKELNALPFQKVNDELDNYIHTTVSGLISGLPIQSLYDNRYPILTRIIGLFTNPDIQSWTMLADELSKIVPNRLEYNAQLNEFLDNLKKPELYNKKTTLRQFLSTLNDNMGVLLGVAFKDMSNEINYLADLLNSPESLSPEMIALGKELNTTISLIDLIALHGALCRGFSDIGIHTANFTFFYNLNNIIYTVPIDKLDMIERVFDIGNSAEDQIDSKFATFIDMARDKAMQIPKINPVTFKSSVRTIRENDNNVFSDILTRLQKILELYNRITDDSIYIIEIDLLTASSFNGSIKVVLGNAANAHDQVLVHKVDDLLEHDIKIFITPSIFDIGAQIVGLYKILKSLQLNHSIAIDLSQIPQDELTAEEYLVKLNALKKYLRDQLNNPDLSAQPKQPSADATPPHETIPRTTSPSISMFSSISGVLFSIAALVASIFIDRAIVFGILPFFIAGLSALNAVLSVVPFKFNRNAVRMVYTIFAYAICVLLVLYIDSLVFVMYNQIQSILLQVPVVYIVLNLVALAMLLMSAFEVPFRFMPMKGKTLVRIRKYLGIASYAISLTLSLTALALQIVSDPSAMLSVGYGLVFLSTVFLFSGSMQQVVPPKYVDPASEEQQRHVQKTQVSRVLQIGALLGIVGVVCATVIYSTVVSYQSGMFASITPYIQLPNWLASKAKELVV